MEDVFRLISNKADPADIKKSLKGKDITSRDKSGQTILHHTCQAGLYDLVVYALKKGASISDTDKNGWTPLHCAASGGHIKICELLLKEGASSIAVSTDGGTPMHYLVRIPWDPSISPKVFSPTLVKQIGDVNALLNRQDESPLHQASLKGSEECVAFLLDQKADVNLQNKLGETPLHFAIRAARPSVIRLLFDYGADPSLVGPQGTCLQLAQQLAQSSVYAEVEDGQARRNTRKDFSKVYRQAPIIRASWSTGTKGRKGGLTKKQWGVLDGRALTVSASEGETNNAESFQLREISTIIIEEHVPNCFTVTLRNGTHWTLGGDDRAEMAKWLFAVDGLRSRSFTSYMDMQLKRQLLQQTYKEGFKGGIVKSSFDEEWAYGGDGTLQCTEGWTGPEFMWDGVELVPKTALGRKEAFGFGRFNGFLYEWLDGDAKVVMRYWTEEVDREYHCEEAEKTWKWTRHFLALKHGRGEWIVENFVPEPVVFFLSLLRYRRLALG